MNAQITRMIVDGYSYDMIAFELGNGIKLSDINNRWNRHLKKSTDIIKPQVPSCRTSRITWTAEMDARIKRMKADGYSYAKIALELGNGLKRNDINNWWTFHLKLIVGETHGVATNNPRHRG